MYLNPTVQLHSCYDVVEALLDEADQPRKLNSAKTQLQPQKLDEEASRLKK